MRNKEKDAAQMAIKRRDFLAKAYELFAKKNIESVTMAEITRECGYGTMTDDLPLFQDEAAACSSCRRVDMGAGHQGELGIQTGSGF